MEGVVVSAVREHRRERLRTAAAWTVFGVLSVGVHHLSLQALDVSGITPPASASHGPVALDLFETPPPPPPHPLPPPTEVAAAAPQVETPALVAPSAVPPAVEAPKPGGRSGRPGRSGGRPPGPAIPEASPGEDVMTLSSEYADPYDPLNPRLRMSDWGSDDFAAADRYFGATGMPREHGLAPAPLRSPLEQLADLDVWGGDSTLATDDFFGESSEGIQLALNPEGPDVLRYAPVDAVVLAYVNLQAIAGGPHADGVTGLLRALPEYQTMIGHVEASLIERADEIYVASSDPTDRSRTVVLVRHHLPEEEMRALVGRQITLAGGTPDWSTVSNLPAVTVDGEHASTTPWLYLFPEPGLVVVAHRANLGPILAALGGQAGRGVQPRLVFQLRRLTEVGGAGDPGAAGPSEGAAPPPTLFAVADSGSLAPYLRFFALAMSGVEIGDLSGGYIRVTGGGEPQIMGGLRLAAPADAPQWATVMRRIESQDLAKAFDFAWAGREDRVFFRVGLTDPVVESGLGIFRLWADRYYSSDAAQPLPEAPALHGAVIGTAVHAPSGSDAGAEVVKPPPGPEDDSRKEDAAASPGADGGTGGEAGPASPAAGA